MVVPQLAPHTIDRGDSIMKPPTIVETYYIGNSTVCIASDCILTDPEEIEKQKKKFFATAWMIVYKAATREQMEKGREKV